MAALGRDVNGYFRGFLLGAKFSPFAKKGLPAEWCGRMDRRMTSLQSLVERCKAYYSIPGNEAGGNLSQVLDQGKTEAGFVLHAYQLCVDAMDMEGKDICDELLKLHVSERDLIVQEMLRL